MSLERAWDFVRRHKWRVLGLSSAVGGAYAVYKLQPKIAEFWQQYKMLKALEAQMKASPSAEQQALRKDLTDKMNRNMRVGDGLVKNFFVSAKGAIDETFPIERLRATMKRRTEDDLKAKYKRTEEDLKAWEEFNQWAVSRAIVGVYAVCILHFLVTYTYLRWGRGTRWWRLVAFVW
jgi:hypothetical protein